MEFRLMGWKVELNLNHLIIMAIVPFAVPYISSALALLLAFIPGQDPSDAIYLATAWLEPILNLILVPLAALVALYLGTKAFKMRADGKTCRSLSLAYLAVWGLGLALSTLAMELSYGFYPYELPYLVLNASIGFVNTILSASVTAFIIYLWMLIFLKPDRKRLEGAVPPSFLFAISALSVEYAMAHLLSQSGIYMVEYYSMAVAPFFALSYFVFGFPILHHMADRKIGPGAYLFSLAYALPLALSIPVGIPHELLFSLGLRISQLLLLYLVSQARSGQPFKT